MVSKLKIVLQSNYVGRQNFKSYENQGQKFDERIKLSLCQVQVKNILI